MIDHSLIPGIAGKLQSKRLKLATVESCTGGWLAMILTSLAGSSHWFERGFVTYSNEAKQECVGVPADLIRQHGAVSEVVAMAMADGGLNHSRADIVLAITGIAGPGGAMPGKPVGTICFAIAGVGEFSGSWCNRFEGDRRAIREQSVNAILGRLSEILEI